MRILKWRILFTFVFSTLTLLVLWTPCQWALMDDPTVYLTVHSLVAHFGVFSGAAKFLKFSYLEGLSVGRFRPAYWIYQLIFYEFNGNPKVAYLLRIGMLACSSILPVLWLEKRQAIKFGSIRPLLLILFLSSIFANYALWDGLIYISLQELSGIFCVSLIFSVVPVNPKELSSVKIAWSIFFLILGTFFKEPFIWVIFTFSFFLFYLQKRKMAIMTVLFGLVALSIILVVSKQGSYTKRAFSFDVERVWLSAKDFLFFGKYTLLIWLISLLTLGKLKFEEIDKTTCAFALSLVLASGLYLLNVIIWGGSLYHWSPVLWLGSVGIFTLVAEGSKDQKFTIKPKYKLLVIIISVLCSFRVIFNKAKYFYLSNRGVSHLIDWTHSQSLADQENICTTGIEMAVTLPELSAIKNKSNTNFTYKRMTYFDMSNHSSNHCKYIISYEDQLPVLKEQTRFVKTIDFGGGLILIRDANEPN